MRQALEPDGADAERTAQLLGTGTLHISRLGQRALHAQARVEGLLGMLPEQLHGAGAPPGAPARLPTAHGDPVAGYRARPRFQVAREHTAERGLARTRGSAERHALPRLDGEREPTEERFRARVPERDVP